MAPTVPGQLTVPQDTFGGLRLDVDPLELGFTGAIDLLDVDIGQDGGLLARPGFQRWSANATDFGSAAEWLFADGASSTVLVTFNTGLTARTLNRDTGVQVTQFNIAAGGSAFTGAAVFNDVLYVSYAAGTGHIINAATGAVVAGAPGARLLDRTPWDNRLVAIGIDAVTGSTQIDFSNPDDATTWDPDDFVIPGSAAKGTVYTASARWRDMLFVFRDNLFFVFTGTSTDSSGGAIFDYRVVDYGVGAASLHAACATPEGVFFLSANGLYLTRGGPAQLVSDAIRPLFVGGVSSEFTAFGAGSDVRIDPIDVTDMAYWRGRLYITVRSTTTDSLKRRMLVYDTQRNVWTGVWSIGGVAVAASDPVNEAGLDEAGTSSLKSGLWVAGPTAHGVTDDDSVWRMVPSGWEFARGQDYSVSGAALQDITGRYRSGYNDFGAPGEKTLRRMLLDGTGTVSRSVFDERNTALGYADETVALGATRSEGWARTSAKGRAFSVQYEGAGDFSLSRVEHVVQRLRQPLMDARV